MDKKLSGFFMSKKRNKHTYENRLKYMKMLGEGYSVNYIHDHYGISDTLLSCLWEKYQAEGASALVKKKSCHLTVEEKLEVIADYEEKHLPLSDIMLNRGVSESAIWSWRKQYVSGGKEALKRCGASPKEDRGKPWEDRKKRSLKR